MIVVITFTIKSRYHRHYTSSSSSTLQFTSSGSYYRISGFADVHEHIQVVIMMVIMVVMMIEFLSWWWRRRRRWWWWWRWRWWRWRWWRWWLWRWRWRWEWTNLMNMFINILFHVAKPFQSHFMTQNDRQRMVIFSHCLFINSMNNSWLIISSLLLMSCWLL